MATKLAISRIKGSSMLKEEAELQRAHLQDKLKSLINHKQWLGEQEM
jgi:hypothetical protein